MAFSTLGVLLSLTASAATPASRGPVAELARGFSAFRAGHYHESARVLDGLAKRLPKNSDYVVYLLAESLFYDGAYARAQAAFSDLSKQRGSRWAGQAAWRTADCQWMQGKRVEAVAAYRKLLASKTAGADATVARFRMAELAAETSNVAEARRLYLQVHLDSPTHPLAAAALLRATAMGAKESTPEAPLTPEERLRRADKLADTREYQAALDELARLPADLPAPLAAERDLATGMAKYKMRRDYSGAAALLQNVSLRLSGEKAASAAFHGARAWSRADRDDDAIAGYRQVVERFPNSKWAAEAQFRSGWLEINRGHFREALPGLQATLARFPRSAFADDAAWYLALAHYLLGQPTEGLRALERYEHVVKSDDGQMRVRYWRARMLAQAGRVDEARSQLRECVRRSPFGFYGLLAAARLRESGEKAAITLPAPTSGTKGKGLAARDPALERSRELLQAGLDFEAGLEAERAESSILKHLGKEHGPALLLSEYADMRAHHRALYLAESHGSSMLSSEPTGGARIFWQAAYPRAFRDMVQTRAEKVGTPELFVYAIMRKESSFLPHALSGSDARGLLQLIPSTGQQVAKHLGEPFFADELFDPEVNVRLGTTYLAGLLKRFSDQVALAAGAYNAGSHAMMRWCDLWGTRPLDEFVELVTYDQAREYIKRVLGIYARYRYLYGEPFQLSLAVDPRYQKDGISD